MGETWRFYSHGRLIASVHAIYTEAIIRTLFPSARVYVSIRMVYLDGRAIEMDARD